MGAIALRCGIALAWAVARVGGTASPSEALPAFARLTGLPCAACHTNFPLLTPLGREFKMKGYQFDTTTPTLGQFAMMTVSSLTHTELMFVDVRGDWRVRYRRQKTATVTRNRRGPVDRHQLDTASLVMLVVARPGWEATVCEVY